MKTIDKYIIIGVGILLVCLMLYGLYSNPIITSQILGGIILAAYGLFVFFHVALLMPVVAIGIFVTEVYDNVYRNLKEHSIIIAELSRGILVTIAIIGTHVLWIYIGSAIFTRNINFLECWQWFGNNVA